MKYLPVLLVVFTSLCVGLPIDLPFGNAGQNIIVQGDPYLQLNVQVIPREVVPGRALTIILDVTNNNNFNLTDVHVKAYDTCIFNDNGENEEIFEYLLPNRSVTKTWVWNAGDTTLEKDCEIKISARYTADYFLSQDIVVLSIDEYLTRQMDGSLNSIPAQTYSSKSPFSVSLSFPENQPFLEKTDGYSMEMEYYNVGDGFLTVYASNISIIGSNNMFLNAGDCVGGSVSSDGKINFINKKSSKITCYFRTATISPQPISIGTMKIEAKYEYLIDTSVSVNVKPGRTTTTTVSHCYGEAISCDRYPFGSAANNLDCGAVQFGCMNPPEGGDHCEGTTVPCENRITESECTRRGSTGCAWY